jgi:PAS domain S-box-containing protein
LTFRNAAFCRSFGLKISPGSPISFRDISPPGFEDLLASLELRSLQGGQSARIEGKVRRDGQKERWHQWNVRAIPASDGSIAEYQAIGRDITEVKIAEEEFVRTEKLLSLSDLAGGIAHDFNNALTSIMGNLNLAKMKVAPDDFIYRRLNEAEAATARAGEITKQLFSFSDRSTPEKETVDMADLIHEAISYSLRGSKSRSRLDLDPVKMPVHVDTAQILQVLQVLIVNADQAMPEGGLVTVGAAPIEVGGDDPIPLPTGVYVRITVHDHGTGIMPKHMGRIFDPYFTTKEHGTGLGLAVALPIIKNHGGWLDVSSTPGEGTTFFLYLPASANGIDVKASPEPAPSAGMGSILLMDDEAGILDTTSDILRYLGYTVTTAQDGEEAVMRFEEALDAGTPFDGVILDLTVPGRMGGLETMQRLKERDPGVKVVVSSGYLNDPIVKNPGKYGFAGSICKPYMVHELGRVLQDMLST